MPSPLLPQSTETLAAQRSETVPPVPAVQMPVQIVEMPDSLVPPSTTLILSGKAVSLDNDLLTLQTSAGNFQLRLCVDMTAAQSEAPMDALKQAYVSKTLLDLVIASSPSPTNNKTTQTATLIVPQKIIPPQPLPTITEAKSGLVPPINPAIGKNVEAILLPPAEDIIGAPQTKAMPAVSSSADTKDGTTATLETVKQQIPKSVASFFEAAKSSEKASAPPVSTPIITEKSLSSFASPTSKLSIQIEAVFPPDYPDEKISLLPTHFLGTALKKADGITTLLQVDKEALFIKNALPIANSEKIVFSVSPTKPSLAIPTQEIVTQLQSVETILQQIVALAPMPSAETASPSVARPDHSLAKALLSLLGCFSRDDASGWVGASTIQSLRENKKENLIRSLEKAIKQERDVFQDKTLTDWTGVTIPFRDTFTDQFQPIHFYYRHIYQDSPEQENNGSESAQKKTRVTRFLVDIRLSHLGAMQLDGLSQEKRLDLIVRSEDSLPSPLPTELTYHYLKSLDGIGFKGSIRFQTDRQNWIDIKQKARGTGVTA